MRIEDEIKQSKPFTNALQKVVVNIHFTSSWIASKQAQAIKPFGLSIQQFNVLRILKGMKNKPATVKLLTERMIDKMSNASRLVDKLVTKQYVRREESKIDRRRVDVYITELGLQTLKEASESMDKLLTESMSSLSEEEAILLSDLMDKSRGA